MSLPRGIEERIDWFLTHKPAATGMCAQHSWHALGGDQGNPPAWGCANANEAVAKVQKSDRAFTGGIPPRGAWVGWKYGSNGHAAISNGDGTITTTDPSNGKPTGTEPLDYPRKWGYTGSADYTVWSDEYAGVRFDVGDEVSHGAVYLSKLRKGQQDSDSVKRLQLHLNEHVLADGSTLPVTGNFGDQTMHEITLDREQHGFPDTSEQVSEAQARHLIPFGECGCTLKVDTTTTPPEPVEPPAAHDGGQVWDHYSGKPSGTLTVTADAGYVRLDANTDPAPGDGLEFHMIYINCDLSWSGSSAGAIRIKYVRDDGDATGYQDYTVRNGASDFLITATHWEAGEKGKGGRWWINVGGGITKAVIGTRYQKAGGVTYVAPTETTVKQGL